MKKLLSLIACALIAASMTACTAAPAPTPTPVPTVEPTVAPAPTATPDEIYDEVLTAVFPETAEELKSYLPDIDAEQFLAMTGLTADLIESHKAVMPMMSQGDQNVVIIVKAAEGKGADVETILNTYKENDMKSKDPAQGGMSYPGDLEKSSATKIVTIGDYVAFYSFDNKMLGAEGDDLIKALEEMNTIAVDKTKEILG